MKDGKIPPNKKLEKMLRKAGIEPSIRDIEHDMLEFSIPLYDDTILSGTTYAGFPIIGNVSDEEKRKIVFDLSSFVIKISNQIIYHTLDNQKESLKSEQNAVALAFLQKAAILHICNHKLSCEGITIERHGKKCSIVDEFKTMPLTRSVYEHLAMFYYLFNYPDSHNQHEIVWKSWILGSKKNLLKENGPEFREERNKAKEEIEEIKRSLSKNELATKCLSNPNGNFNNCLNSNSLFSIIRKGDQYIAEKLTYDKAWKYLYGESINLSLIYNYLSLHSHPTYNGLAQFNSQKEHIEFPLYESCLYLAYLCRLYMKKLQIDRDIIIGACTKREQGIYSFLSNECNNN